jgi:hypothetical protein
MFQYFFLWWLNMKLSEVEEVLVAFNFNLSRSRYV